MTVAFSRLNLIFTRTDNETLETLSRWLETVPIADRINARKDCSGFIRWVCYSDDLTEFSLTKNPVTNQHFESYFDHMRQVTWLPKSSITRQVRHARSLVKFLRSQQNLTV